MLGRHPKGRECDIPPRELRVVMVGPPSNGVPAWGRDRSPTRLLERRAALSRNARREPSRNAHREPARNVRRDSAGKVCRDRAGNVQRSTDRHAQECEVDSPRAVGGTIVPAAAVQRRIVVPARRVMATVVRSNGRRTRKPCHSADRPMTALRHSIVTNVVRVLEDLKDDLHGGQSGQWETGTAGTRIHRTTGRAHDGKLAALPIDGRRAPGTGRDRLVRSDPGGSNVRGASVRLGSMMSARPTGGPLARATGPEPVGTGALPAREIGLRLVIGRRPTVGPCARVIGRRPTVGLPAVMAIARSLPAAPRVMRTARPTDMTGTSHARARVLGRPRSAQTSAVI